MQAQALIYLSTLLCWCIEENDTMWQNFLNWLANAVFKKRNTKTFKASYSSLLLINHSFTTSFTRADKGKYTVLVGQSVARKREKITRFREILMTEALNKVQRMNPEKFILTVSIKGLNLQ